MEIPNDNKLCEQVWHRKENPRWYLEISREQRQVNSHNKAIGLGSFFKLWPYDYTNDELKDMKITSAWLIYSPPTGNGAKMRTMILSFQHIGWSTQWKLTTPLIGVLVLGHGNAS